MSEVIGSLAWSCKTCDASGFLHLDCAPDVLGLLGRIKTLHREASPKCEAVPGFDQIEIPEDAKVNDPRGRHVVKPMSASMIAPIAAAVLAASGGSTFSPPSRRGLRATPTMREQRDAERLARKDRLVARAEAKRARRSATRASSSQTPKGE